MSWHEPFLALLRRWKLSSIKTKNCPVVVEAVFDEYNLDISLTYEGEPIELSDKRPSDQEIRESEVGTSRLAGYLIRRNADRVNVIHTAACATVKLHFEH